MENESMNSAGRPVVLDAEKKGQVIVLLRSGCSKRRAAAYVGVAESTIRQAERQDLEFAACVARAGLHFAVDLESKMRAQAGKSWRAAAWILERRLPDEFGRPRKRARERVAKSHRQTSEEVVECDRG